MRIPPIRFLPQVVSTLAWLTALAAPAGAHEYWLAPSTYRAAAGDTVEVRAWVGTGFRGEIKPWAGTRAERFLARHARDLDLKPAASHGALVWARFVAPDGGGAMVGYESNYAEVEMSGPEFDRYLALEGLDGPLQARKRARPGAVKERYARCPKAWVAGSDPARATRPLGLTLELVPLSDPVRATNGHLQVRLLHRGKPLSGALVRAWRRPLDAGARPFDAATRDSVPPVTESRTDRGGIAAVRIDREGEWLLSAVHMQKSRDRTADWESGWASLTFASAPLPSPTPPHQTPSGR